MATLKIRGMDDLQKKLATLSKDIEVELADKMLDAGAEVAINVWKDEIKMHDHIETGDMINSVGVTKQTKKGSIREIYPLGRDRRGKRNAFKAFVLHYGWKGHPGDLFVDDIEVMLNKSARPAMKKVLDDYFKSKGL